jgi:NucS shadow ORF
MSLNVSPDLLDQARGGEISDDAFVGTVRTSLPYAYRLIGGLAAELNRGSGIPFADNQVPPPGEAERGQLLRALASDSIRGSLERHFGVRLAVQNCHRVAAFRAGDSGPAYQEFISARSQVLNQSPALRNC